MASSPQRHRPRSPSGDEGHSPTRPEQSRPTKRLRTSPNESNEASSRTGPRRKVACQSCRIRKIKCDASRPRCALCKAAGHECEYLDEAEKLTLEKSTQLLCDRLDTLQSSVDKLKRAKGEVDVAQLPSLSQAFPTQGSLYRNLTQDADASTSEDDIVATASKDFLEIPPHRTSADAVLTWEIFEDRYAPHTLISCLFTPEVSDTFSVPGGLKLPNEESVPQLVDSFLQNVHTKNPILDVESLVKHARVIGAEGFGWDGWSCLVLVVCALGALASRHDATSVASRMDAFEQSSPTSTTTPRSKPKDRQVAESYFVLATRRLGMLKHTLLGAQCYFFAGVYLMYTLRPLVSWQYFTQASAIYQLYVKTTYGLSNTESNIAEAIERMSNRVSVKQRRLEQSLYWSCFKTESEFRVELPLPQSEIASYDHPQMFPSPPTPGGLEPGTPLDDKGDGEQSELRAHSKRLCNEEESWYYYLTEIALRRIGNRIVNTFFQRSARTWKNIQPLLSIAFEFDTQVSSWSAHLPPAMQDWETTYTIRAPNSGSVNGDEGGHYVSKELSWAIDNRLLEVRSWLCQPFLYYLIHSQQRRTQPGGAGSNVDTTSASSFAAVTAGLNHDDAAILRHMVTTGITTNLTILARRSLHHRHHGLWFDLRALMCASLILLAVVKAGMEWAIPGGAQALLGSVPDQGARDQFGGILERVVGEFDSWVLEAPDMIRHRDVLVEIAKSVQTQRHALGAVPKSG